MKGTGFLRKLYRTNREHLKGLILREEEFDPIIDTCSKLTAKVYSHNRKKDVEGISMLVVFALSISAIILFAYFFLMYYGVRDQNQRMIIAGYFMLGISVFITTIIMIVNFF